MKGKRFLAVLCALLSLTGALSLLVPSFGMQHLTYAQSHAPVGTPRRSRPIMVDRSWRAT